MQPKKQSTLIWKAEQKCDWTSHDYQMTGKDATFYTTGVYTIISYQKYYCESVKSHKKEYTDIKKSKAVYFGKFKYRS